MDRLQCYSPYYCSLHAKGNSFWTHTFNAYNVFFRKMKPNLSELLAEPVCYNENTKIGNKVIKHANWIESEVYHIAHFLKDNDQFLSITEFKARFGLKVDFLTFNGCIS